MLRLLTVIPLLFYIGLDVGTHVFMPSPLPEKYVVTEETRESFKESKVETKPEEFTVESKSSLVESVSNIIRDNQGYGANLEESTIQHMANSIVHFSSKYSVPVEEVLAVIRIESVFDPTVVGSHQDRGLMQIIPSTERFLAEQLNFSNYDIFDIDTNIEMGVYYISRNKEQYGNWLCYVAYNQGLSEPLNQDTLNQHFSREDSYVSMVRRFSNKYRNQL